MSLKWLADHAYDHEKPTLLPAHARIWDAGLTDIPTGDMTALQSDQAALQTWLAGIRRHGFARVSGMNA